MNLPDTRRMQCLRQRMESLCTRENVVGRNTETRQKRLSDHHAINKSQIIALLHFVFSNFHNHTCQGSAAESVQFLFRFCSTPCIQKHHAYDKYVRSMSFVNTIQDKEW